MAKAKPGPKHIDIDFEAALNVIEATCRTQSMRKNISGKLWERAHPLGLRMADVALPMVIEKLEKQGTQSDLQKRLNQAEARAITAENKLASVIDVVKE